MLALLIARTQARKHATLVLLFAAFAVLPATVASPVQFTGTQTAPGEWTYTLTYDSEDNYSVCQASTTITLTGLTGVTQASAPTSTDYPSESGNATNLLWLPQVLDGGRSVVWSHAGGGTGNYGDPRHVFGFKVIAPGLRDGTINVTTDGFALDDDCIPENDRDIINVVTSGPAHAYTPRRHLRGKVQGFEISSVTPAGAVVMGESGSAAVVVDRLGGHDEAITLGIASNAQGITGTGSIPSGTSSGMLTIAVPVSTAAGTYPLDVEATDGLRTHSLTFDLEVSEVPSGSATLSASRAYHTETLLPNGKVLLVGGRGSSSTYLTSADLYNPASGLINPTGSMATGRVSHTATLLNNGKVLIAGGFTSSTNGTTSAELYDPATGAFTATGSMTRPRGAHTATLLPSGEVLITGGYSGSKNTLANFPTTCELYDPTAGTFHDTGSLTYARAAHRATAVFGATFPAAVRRSALAAAEDRVLISGGYAAGTFVKNLEWYSVASGSFTTLSVSLATGRALHTAVLLSNSKVLLAGGAIDDSLGFATATAELYDVATNTIGATGSLAAKRGAQTSTVVDGKVVVCGGSDFATVQASVESYDPGTGSFTTLMTPMTATRTFHTATLLDSGSILITGGAYASGFTIIYRDTVELYTPPSP